MSQTTNFQELSHLEKEKAMIPLIMTTLQDAGGQLTKQEIIERISDMDDGVAAFANEKRRSQKTGAEYSQFAFKFNFALKNLKIAGYLDYDKRNPLITLSEKGQKVILSDLDIEKDIYSIADSYWKEKRQNKASENDAEEDISQEEQYEEAFKERLLDAISKMSPKKFELFSRKLLTEMGVEFDKNIGVQVSNDGGIDGYGYHCDSDDFRTTRVVIQCKRYNGHDVGSPEIDKFLGTMNKFQADYGIFITNSRYSTSAKAAARAGTPITLIDGNELTRLVIKYKLYIKPIQTYELLDFYQEEQKQ